MPHFAHRFQWTIVIHWKLQLGSGLWRRVKGGTLIVIWHFQRYAIPFFFQNALSFQYLQRKLLLHYLSYLLRWRFIQVNRVVVCFKWRKSSWWKRHHWGENTEGKMSSKLSAKARSRCVISFISSNLDFGSGSRNSHDFIRLLKLCNSEL